MHWAQRKEYGGLGGTIVAGCKEAAKACKETPMMVFNAGKAWLFPIEPLVLNLPELVGEKELSAADVVAGVTGVVESEQESKATTLLPQPNERLNVASIPRPEPQSQSEPEPKVVEELPLGSPAIPQTASAGTITPNKAAEALKQAGPDLDRLWEERFSALDPAEREYRGLIFNNSSPTPIPLVPTLPGRPVTYFFEQLPPPRPNEPCMTAVLMPIRKMPTVVGRQP
ncbi:MAG: hypothetical protein V4490_02415 [Pseudomonadota bacterium]